MDKEHVGRGSDGKGCKGGNMLIEKLLEKNMLSTKSSKAGRLRYYGASAKSYNDK